MTINVTSATPFSTAGRITRPEVTTDGGNYKYDHVAGYLPIEIYPFYMGNNP